MKTPQKTTQKCPPIDHLGVSLRISNSAIQSTLQKVFQSCYSAPENKYLFIPILTKADKKKPLFVHEKEIITIFSKISLCSPWHDKGCSVSVFEDVQFVSKTKPHLSD